MAADRVVGVKVVMNFMPNVWTVEDMSNLMATVGGFVRCNIVMNRFTGECFLLPVS